MDEFEKEVVRDRRRRVDAEHGIAEYPDGLSIRAETLAEAIRKLGEHPEVGRINLLVGEHKHGELASIVAFYWGETEKEVDSTTTVEYNNA